ncbi:uncharacterized protein LOC126569259 [Anopheles aquasalis]|uniref:uncharacterized protein LOC126569259 n=1 Tax=Anopheles aquasalis TaxID=42839 RepID=UPI00215B4694|nr:uncharacterized protein LOC126569259 [Anopheles aquasalis]
MAQSMHFARVSIKVQGVALCLLLACVLQNAVVHSSENAPSTPEEVQDGVMESAEPLVETKPIEMEGLGLEARMALPDTKEIVDENKMIGAVINKEGGLDPVYPANRSALGRSKREALYVLKPNADTTKAKFGSDSYPPNYPIKAILKKVHGAGYENVFSKEIVIQNLTDRIDDPTGGYMCTSKMSQEYPTYDPNTKTYIVNVKGFYQGIVFDVCNEVGKLCSEICHSMPSEFVCHQSYGTMEVVVAREQKKGGEVELSLARIGYPSSCKCQRVQRKDSLQAKG